MAKKMIACDGNEATASVAFAVSEVAAIYRSCGYLPDYTV